MTTLNISISDSLQDFLDREASKAGFNSSAEYVESLIREDQKRKLRLELERQLITGLESGPATEMTASDWDEIRREVQKRAAARSANFAGRW